MPTGMFVRRRRDKNFIKEYPTPISNKSTAWLANLEVERNINLQHARNNKEYRIGSKLLAVDGYCQ